MELSLIRNSRVTSLQCHKNCALWINYMFKMQWNTRVSPWLAKWKWPASNIVILLPLSLHHMKQAVQKHYRWKESNSITTLPTGWQATNLQNTHIFMVWTYGCSLIIACFYYFKMFNRPDATSFTIASQLLPWHYKDVSNSPKTFLNTIWQIKNSSHITERDIC